jgi:hypothetical protein
VNAVRLGLEVENDVRVAADRINQLKLTTLPNFTPLPRIPDPPREALVEESPAPPAEDPMRGMPLL